MVTHVYYSSCCVPQKVANYKLENTLNIFSRLRPTMENTLNIFSLHSLSLIPCTNINRKCFLIDADEFIVECIEGHFSSLAPNFSQYKLAMGCKWIGSNSFLEGAKINYGD